MEDHYPELTHTMTEVMPYPRCIAGKKYRVKIADSFSKKLTLNGMTSREWGNRNGGQFMKNLSREEQLARIAKARAAKEAKKQ